MSWTCQITAESSGQWACSALHFATKEEAEKYMLMMREHASRIARVVESGNEVNARFVDGKLRANWPR
jgi:hypothetical protein